MGAASFLHMTLMGGLTDVVGVGRLGDDVVMLGVVVEFDLEAVILELLLMELLDEMVLELDEDLVEICEFVCCWSCCLHFARRFLNQTC